MKNLVNKLAVIITLLSLQSITAAHAADSTSVTRPKVNPVAQAYLLTANKVTTQIGYYAVNQLATHQRCSSVTHPVLSTSVSSINVYGVLQAIEGVNNTVTLNSSNYMLTGQVSAPVNIAGARDNGVTLNWQIWCEPNQAA